MDLNKTNFLVCTCAKTKDIAFHMLTSFFKNIDPLMNLKIYLGTSIGDFGIVNNALLHIIDTPQSNWKEETIFQLKYLRTYDPNCKFIVLLLDDFIFKSSINIITLNHLIEYMKSKEIKYLSLKPSFDNFFMKVIDFINSFKILNNISIYKIRDSHPYFYSLQAGIWNIDYLLDSLEKCENIWHFENMNPCTESHFASSSNILDYTHIVEKGEWDFQASEICQKSIGFFSPGNRKFRYSTLKSRLLVRVRSLFFFIFGYFFLRIRIYLNFKK